MVCPMCSAPGAEVTQFDPPDRTDWGAVEGVVVCDTCFASFIVWREPRSRDLFLRRHTPAEAQQFGANFYREHGFGDLVERLRAPRQMYWPRRVLRDRVSFAEAARGEQ